MGHWGASLLLPRLKLLCFSLSFELETGSRGAEWREDEPWVTGARG